MYPKKYDNFCKLRGIILFQSVVPICLKKIFLVWSLDSCMMDFICHLIYKISA